MAARRNQRRYPATVVMPASPSSHRSGREVMTWSYDRGGGAVEEEGEVAQGHFGGVLAAGHRKLLPGVQMRLLTEAVVVPRRDERGVRSLERHCPVGVGNELEQLPSLAVGHLTQATVVPRAQIRAFVRPQRHD